MLDSGILPSDAEPVSVLDIQDECRTHAFEVGDFGLRTGFLSMLQGLSKEDAQELPKLRYEVVLAVSLRERLPVGVPVSASHLVSERS